MEKIISYDFGRIVIDFVEYLSDIVILPNGKVEKWWREESHNVSLNDIKEILSKISEKNIDVMIIGTGYSGMMNVSKEVIKKHKLIGIKKLIIESTKNAVEIYNDLLRKEERIIAALHLTC